MRNLTEKQQRVLITVSNYVNENGYPPSRRELGDILNLRSSSTVKGYLDKLKKEGYLTWNEGMPRTLRILDREKETTVIS
ncbi:transcriptional regulator [Bacillus badius]|uniref:LexA family protein n=1 Tax=Bacillus badius TaxID=1455 RepID=UPI001CBF88DE|nr:transcriptional regulator [Bacillus badius]UAT31989.1 transcriptional regulator [Bacillus badius]